IFADSSPDRVALEAGTVVGFPHFWQSKVIPAAAASTTKEVEQCAQAKTISGLAVCIRRSFKQETYRTQCGKGFAARARGHARRSESGEFFRIAARYLPGLSVSGAEVSFLAASRALV